MKRLDSERDQLFQRLEHDTSEYLVKGERVVSVTEALRIAGVVDFSDVPRDRLYEGAQRGTLVHAITAHLDGGAGADWDRSMISDEIGPYVDAYLQFKLDTGFEPTQVEQIVVNDIHRYAGRLDRAGPLYGDFSLIDLKTGAGSIPSWVALQLQAYAGCHPYSSMDTAPRRFGLRLTPDGKYSLHRFRDIADRADWLAVLRVAQWQLRHGGWSLD
jgi:hypothetical protein